jgi:hypothetical protein
MDAYDRCTNLEKILAIVLPSMVETENFSGHPRVVGKVLQNFLPFMVTAVSLSYLQQT